MFYYWPPPGYPAPTSAPTPLFMPPPQQPPPPQDNSQTGEGAVASSTAITLPYWGPPPQYPPHLHYPTHPQSTQQSIPPLPPPRDPNWVCATSEQTHIIELVHRDCDTCRMYSEHKEHSIITTPIPQEAIQHLISCLIDHYPAEFKHFSSSPNPHDNLFARLGIVDPRKPSDARRPTYEDKFSHLLEIFEKELPKPALLYSHPIIINQHWVPSPESYSLHYLPSPIYYLPQSQFQSIDSFFNLNKTQYSALSPDDTLRFRRASMNTHPTLRTETMIEAVQTHKRTLRKIKDDQPVDCLVTPYGFPEQYWPLMDEYIRNPKGLPSSTHIFDDHVCFWDTYIHIWTSSVTWSRDSYLTTLLLILFGNRSAALGYLWNRVLVPTGRRAPIPHAYRSWPFSVPPHIAFRCKYDLKDITIPVLTAYLEFLLDVGHFPLFDVQVLTCFCDWAENLLLQKKVNDFSEGQISEARIEAVRNAHKDKPWFRTDGVYDHYPLLHPPLAGIY
jgi:hypothetical protein